MSSPPSSSQYGGRMCSLWFHNEGPLRVPIDILNKCPQLVARLHIRSCDSGPLDQANFSDISPSTGHVIIHYLLTERYQSLKPSGITEDERNRSELATAFWVHVRAGALEIPSLQELAQAEMKRLISKMNLISVVQTLDGTGISLNNNPVLEELLANQIDLALTKSSKECLDSLITQLGLPKTVCMFLLEHILESQKALLDTQGYNYEETSTDLSWVQFGKEFQALVQKFSRQDPVDKDLTFQRELRVTALRESQEKTALECLMSQNGSLDDIDLARLETLQSNATLRTELLADCENDIAASKEQSRQMSLDAVAIAKRLIKEQRYESLLQCRKAQHGFLSFKQLHRLLSPGEDAEEVSNHHQTRLETAEEATSQQTDAPSDDGIMTPNTGSVYESATEKQSLLIKDETVRPSRAHSERIARLRLEMDNKRLRSRLREADRLSNGDYVILAILFILLIFW